MRAVLVLLGWTLPVIAASASPTAVERARADVARAEALYDQGRYVEALVAYRAAEPHGAALGDLAGLRFMIARCLQQLEHADEAIFAFERYLELPDEPTTKARARDYIEALRAKLPATIRVACEGGELLVALEGTVRSACPAIFSRLPPGPQRVVAYAGDRAIDERTVEMAAGETKEVAFAAPGRLNVRSPHPTARILVDGTRAGEGALAGYVVAAGEHTVVIEAAGLPTWKRDVTVGAGQTVQVSADVTAEDGGPGPLPWIAGGASLAVAAGGVALLLGASDAADDARAAQRRYDEATSADDAESARDDVVAADEDARLRRTLGYVALGAAAAGVAASVWLFLDGDEASAAVVPLEGGAALGWSGRW